MYSSKQNHSLAFAIFQETICDGLVPTWRDENGFPVTYATEREAQIEVAELLIAQLEQFVAGEREFDDALVSGDIILPVTVCPSGTIQLKSGRRFGAIPP